MIRINLLPGKRAKRQDAGQRHLLFMGMGVLAAVGGIVFLHISASNRLDDLNRQNNIIKAEIDRLKAELGDYDKIKGQREELMKQRKTIENLDANRTGPVFVLRELSEILTPGKGPTFDRITYEENLRKDPNAGFNASWETKRVWLDSFEEEGRRVKIRGAAKSNEDVAEFWRRLGMSVFFTEVTPEGTNQTSATREGSVKHVLFSGTAGVIY
jgi:type IV pilus assembly protein PilN